MSKTLKGFITYSHEDTEAKDELRKRLSVMEQNKELITWDDGQLTPGDGALQEDILKKVADSDLLLYLVSASSLDSKNCNRELAEALKEELRVIPIILEDCDWLYHQLSGFEVIPHKGKPINEWQPESKGWQNVVKGIRRVINKMQIQSKPSSKTIKNKRVAEWVFQQGNFLFMLKQMNKAIQAYSDAIDLNPNNANAHNNRGAAYGSQGEYKKAIEDFTKAIAIDPRNANAYNNRGLAHYKDEVDKAIEDYSRAIKLNSDFTSAYINRGVAYHHKGKYEHAIENYNKAIELNPDDALGYNNRGLAYNLNGEHDRAIDNYNEVIKRDPFFPEIYYNRGAAYGAKGEVDLLIKDCSKAIELKPDHAGAYRNRGVAYCEKGEVNQAIADFTAAIQLNPNDAKVYRVRGVAYCRKGDFDRGINDFTTAIKLNPSDAEIYYLRGNAYNDIDETDRAIKDYTTATELNPNYADAYYNRGNLHGKKGDVDKAIEDHTKTIELKPDYDKAYITRGTFYGEKGELDKAIKDFDRAIQLKPDDDLSYHNRGTAYVGKGELDKAIKDYTKVIELKPDYAEAYRSRGNAYDKKDEIDKAIKDFSAAIKFKRDYAEAYQNRGIAYDKKGELDNAIKDFDMSIQLNSEDANTYNNRSVVYSKKGFLDLTLQDLIKAIELSPKNSVFYHNRGNAYGKKGELDKAIEDYNKAIELKPDYAEVFYNRGHVFSIKREYDKAIEDYNKAIAMNLKNASVYNNRGVVYYEKGETNQAIEDYTMAIELDPEDAIAYYNRGEAWLSLREWEKAKTDLTASKRKGGDIIDLFHNDYKNVETYEKRHRVKLPEDIALMLTQRRRDRYPKMQKVLDAEGKPLESPNVVNLRAQLRDAGTPLGEYVKSKPTFGINTAPTEAFVIDKATRAKLLEEHPSSMDILKPFLHGQDLRRWYVDKPQQWLIFTHRGIAINDYPAILKHLEKYQETLSKRKGKQEWYELPVSLNDAERFAQPKLVCPDTYNHQAFAVDTAGYYYGKTSYLIPTQEKWLCGLLNSRTVEWFYSQVSNQLTIDPLRARSGYIQQIPIPDITPVHKALITKVVDYLIYLQQQPEINSKDLKYARDRIMLGYFERVIDGLVYEAYLPEELHKSDKVFLQPLLDEALPSIEEIQGHKMSAFRDIFELLYDRMHLVRRHLYFLDSIKPVRIIQGKL